MIRSVGPASGYMAVLVICLYINDRQSAFPSTTTPTGSGCSVRSFFTGYPGFGSWRSEVKCTPIPLSSR